MTRPGAPDRDARLHALAGARWRVAITLTAATVVLYFGFICLIAYRKPLLVSAGFLLVIALLLAARVQTLGQLALISVTLTFLDCMQMATVSALAGLHAGKASRGRKRSKKHNAPAPLTPKHEKDRLIRRHKEKRDQRHAQ